MFVGIYFIFSALSSLHLINGAATKANDNSTIAFRQDVTDGEEIVEVPEECKNQDYCTIKPKNYPQELFNNMLKGKFKGYQPTYMIDDDLDRDDLEDRAGNPNSMDDCSKTVTFEPVFQVKDNGSWKTVVQAPEENYVQKVRIESCDRVGSSCFNGFEALGLQTVCAQMYTPWEIRVSVKGEELRTVTVILPSCCSCRYKRVD
ncbi:hypothetical protein PYW07_001489 [Mythimna separata]|uniref:Spaetzle domain-containing protein n=1 Tax=Mythimna separata TaxID=271217 RepID=A0AAD8DVX4_MYTSE|nr:hypothetical protein PYW07_001489 [Mythimna separata]